jgi:hypothetical protein
LLWRFGIRRLCGFRFAAVGRGIAFGLFFFCRRFVLLYFALHRQAALVGRLGSVVRCRCRDAAFRACRIAACIFRLIRTASRKAQRDQSCEEGCEHFRLSHIYHLYLQDTEKIRKVQRNLHFSEKSHIFCAGLSSSSSNSSSDSSRASR